MTNAQIDAGIKAVERIASVMEKFWKAFETDHEEREKERLEYEKGRDPDEPPQPPPGRGT